LWGAINPFENSKIEILSLACLPFHHSRIFDHQRLAIAAIKAERPAGNKAI
jgi:hypothetical protein